jgi:non-ribosomal peptide synthetase component F
LDPGTAKLDQTWEAIEYADRLEVRVEYNRDLFREETIARMLHHYQVLLESIVTDPDRPISQLPILADPESR